LLTHIKDEAPVYVAWSAKNRSPLIRIPAARGEATRVELRCPDPACNPYLALATILAAGLDGIEKKIDPPASTDTNIFEMSKKERVGNGILCLPKNLKEAIDEAKKSEFVKQVLGSHVFDKFIMAKEEEWYNYRTRVTQWEIDNYLTKY
jgi:glutamine synthetase